MPDLVAQRSVHRLERHVDAVAAMVEHPAVIGTLQSVVPDLCVFKGGTAVRATRPDQPHTAIAAAESHEIFAQHAYRIGNIPQIL